VAYRAVCGEAGRDVRGVRGPGKIRLVAGVAGCRRCRVVVVRVALRASHGSVEAGQGVICIGRVIERNGGPVTRVMAGVARGGEGYGDVIRIRSASEICLVAAVAIGRQRGVVVIRMALRACKRGMRSGQRKHGSMVEGRRGPVSRRVAQCAIGGEACRHVSWIRRPGKVRLVAAVAGCGQRCVVVIRVAGSTGNRGMRAGQRERGCVVIESRPGPIRSGVACSAGGGEAGGHVIGTGGSGEIGFVA